MAEPQTPIPAKPPSVHDLDAELAKTAHGLWRSRWRALLIFAVLAAAGVLVLAAVALRQAAINQQQADRLHASCQFYLDIAQAPITLPPGATRPSSLGVKIVADSWVAYHHQGCGASPPPTPSLRHWATYYHLRLTSEETFLPRIIGPSSTFTGGPTPTQGNGSVLVSTHAPRGPARSQPPPPRRQPLPHPATAPAPQPVPPPVPLPTVLKVPTPTISLPVLPGAATPGSHVRLPGHPAG